MDPSSFRSTQFDKSLEEAWQLIQQEQKATSTSGWRNLLPRVFTSQQPRFIQRVEVRKTLTALRNLANSSKEMKDEIVQSLFHQSFEGIEKRKDNLYDKLGDVVTFLQKNGVGSYITAPFCQIIRAVYTCYKKSILHDGLEDLNNLMANLNVSKRQTTIDIANEQAIVEVFNAHQQEFSHAIQAVHDNISLSTGQIYEVKSFVRKLKVCFNEVAVRELFVALEKDPLISSDVVRHIRMDWDKSGEIIGTSIKDNTTVFSQKRRAEIIRYAQDLSFQLEFGEELEVLCEKMKQDVLQGKMVITSRLQDKYPEFYRLQQLDQLTSDQQEIWTRQFQRIMNDAYLFQELTKRQRNKQRTASFVEDTLIQEGFGLNANDDKRTDAELDALRLLLDAEGFDDQTLDDFSDFVRAKKLQARLQAVGLSENRARELAAKIPVLEDQFTDLQRHLVEESNAISGLPSNYPKLATKWLLSIKKQRMVAYFETLFCRYIQSLQPDLQKNANLPDIRLPDPILEVVLNGAISAYIDKDLLSMTTFCRKWHHRIVGEMVQGLDDMDAIFHKGACHGIATEWVLQEVKAPYLSAEEFVAMAKVGTVTSKQRFMQLEGTMRHDKTMHDVECFTPEHFWNFKNLKQHKIAFVLPIAIIEAKVEDQACKLKEKLNSERSALADSHGTVFLIMQSHSIYLRQDEKRACRLGDSNVGVLDFSKSNDPKSELYECLHDLLTMEYSDNTFLVGCQFIPE